ncbi:MAG TPA: SDR family NAD(P)-dependent oxidoreductase, partial [Chloroflexia bacterium]|nr:SDR family NAD(P)-dependent oxidoreductase [Chloroflexia bacterium]
LAYRGIPIQSAYCGAKHAIQGFTESVRAELIHDKSNVRISMVQLPGINTPQFSWVKNNLPGKPKPTGPVFQPEVAAEAIVWAAYNEHRELNLGAVTDVILLGNKIIPGFGDYYLGKTGFEAQQTKEPDDPERPNNLWEPVPGDFGVQGRFGDKAKGRSTQLWLRMHRRIVALVGTGLVAGALAAVRKESR